jgi:hypothetical protein
MRASAEMRSSASRSEMSRTCRETRRSSGVFHAGSAARSSLDNEHDWARAGTATNDNPVTSRTIVRRPPDRLQVTTRSGLGASPRRSCPVKNRDVSLSLDARTERKSDDIENSVNRLTRKRCGQVKIRQR